jgi:hypothetical protein
MDADCNNSDIKKALSRIIKDHLNPLFSKAGFLNKQVFRTEKYQPAAPAPGNE